MLLLLEALLVDFVIEVFFIENKSRGVLVKVSVYPLPINNRGLTAKSVNIPSSPNSFERRQWIQA